MDRQLRYETLRKRLKRLRRLAREAERMEQAKLDTIPAVGSDRGPGVDGVPLDISYSDRGPRDVVLSGPLGQKVDSEKNPGRWFATTYEALEWASAKYGEERIRLIYPVDGAESVRWAILVKNLKTS